MNEVKKILVPVDFSDNSEKILKSAIYVAKKFEASLTVIFVAQSFFEDHSDFFVPHVPIVEIEQDIFKSSQKKLASFIDECMDKTIPHDSKVLTGDVADGILEFAEEEKVDWIIMGTHGYKGLDKLLFGSVAEKVVKMAQTIGLSGLPMSPLKIIILSSLPSTALSLIIDEPRTWPAS